MGRILIMDDDEQVLLSLSEVVKVLGHTVATAPDGKRGLELFERERFDCVITDLAMPDVDGLTVLQRVKSRRPDTGVLVVTGNLAVDCLAASVNRGVDAYVTKPFKISEMHEQLSRLLARQAQRGASQRSAPLAKRLWSVRVPLAWVIAASGVVLAIIHFSS